MNPETPGITTIMENIELKINSDLMNQIMENIAKQKPLQRYYNEKY